MTATAPGRTHPSRPETRALLVVDVQPTFCENGELPVPGGDAVAEAIAAFLVDRRTSYDLVVTTQDWHVDPGAHFAGPEGPDYVDTWPPHGIAGTPNAQLHPVLSHLAADPEVVAIRKGQNTAAYSGFDGVDGRGRPLATVLREARVTAVDVVGIASSHCVAATALDAAALGLRTRVVAELTVGVSADLETQAFTRLRAAGVEVVDRPDPAPGVPRHP